MSMSPDPLPYPPLEENSAGGRSTSPPTKPNTRPTGDTRIPAGPSGSGAYRDRVRGSSSRALWRVRPYLRPYAAQLATMVVASLSGIGAAVAVPLAIRRIVDGP